LHFVVRLFPDTIQGGAVLDPPFQADVIIADSDDVYGVFRIDDKKSYFEMTIEQRY